MSGQAEVFAPRCFSHLYSPILPISHAPPSPCINEDYDYRFFPADLYSFSDTRKMAGFFDNGFCCVKTTVL